MPAPGYARSVPVQPYYVPEGAAPGLSRSPSPGAEPYPRGSLRLPVAMPMTVPVPVPVPLLAQPAPAPRGAGKPGAGSGAGSGASSRAQSQRSGAGSRRGQRSGRKPRGSGAAAWSATGAVASVAAGAAGEAGKSDPLSQLCCSRDRCLHLQKELGTKGASMVDSICDKLGDSIENMLAHRYGNYLFQRLVAVATDAQKRRIVGAGAAVERRSRRRAGCSWPRR